METKNKIIIDLEFTGLQDHDEIIQVKMKNLNNNKSIIRNFKSKYSYSITAVSILGTSQLPDTKDYFSKSIFFDMLIKIGTELNNSKFIGFSTEKDEEMLKKYNINIRKYLSKVSSNSNYIDIQLLSRLVTEYEAIIATQGSRLEAIYYLVTGKIAKQDTHDNLSELHIIESIYNEMKNKRFQEYLYLFPYGRLAGKDLKNMDETYLKNVRRHSNAFDHALLISSIDNAIGKSDNFDNFYDFDEYN